MKKIFLLVCLAVVMALTAGAKEFEKVPVAWKWLNEREAIFSYDGSLPTVRLLW